MLRGVGGGEMLWAEWWYSAGPHASPGSNHNVLYSRVGRMKPEKIENIFFFDGLLLQKNSVDSRVRVSPPLLSKSCLQSNLIWRPAHVTSPRGSDGW